MTKDDVIRMAQEAGLTHGQYWLKANMTTAFIHDFANLVAAQEREACAKVCEDASTPPTGEILTDGQWAAKVLAGKIRARGTT